MYILKYKWEYRIDSGYNIWLEGIQVRHLASLRNAKSNREWIGELLFCRHVCKNIVERLHLLTILITSKIIVVHATIPEDLQHGPIILQEVVY